MSHKWRYRLDVTAAAAPCVLAWNLWHNFDLWSVWCSKLLKHWVGVVEYVWQCRSCIATTVCFLYRFRRRKITLNSWPVFSMFKLSYVEIFGALVESKLSLFQKNNVILIQFLILHSAKITRCLEKGKIPTLLDHWENCYCLLREDLK